MAVSGSVGMKDIAVSMQTPQRVSTHTFTNVTAAVDRLQEIYERNTRFLRDRFEAYVYHDKFQSYVTVGGFDSENDPEIKRLAEVFMAKYKPDEENGGYSLAGESLSLPGRDPTSPPLQTWAFDPIPELIEVPRLK